MRKLATLLLTTLGASALVAQFSISGQYRSRGEVRNGFKKPILEDTEPGAFIEHRARITTSYKKDKVGFKLSVQDVRIWGEVGQINKSDQLLSAHEAYGDYYASEKSTFRIGRQEVIYDGHRLFGSLDWAMQGRSLDAVRYMYKDKKGNQFHVMASWNQAGFGDGAPEPAKLTGNNYSISVLGGTSRIFNLGVPKSQLMTYYKKTIESTDVAVMLLHDIYNSDATSGENHSNTTIGVTPNYKSGDLKLGGQFYYTGGLAGKVANATGGFDEIKLGGYMFNAYLQHTGIAGSPLLGVDYISGDDESTGDKVEGWSPSYGTNHKFYGFMDYFYVGNAHGGGNAASAGLLDIYLKTAFKVGKKSKVLAHLHYFASAEGRTSAVDGKTYDGTLGTELDLVFVHKLAPELVLKAGYSQMYGITETMKQLKFQNPNQEVQGLQSWGWLMVAFSPKFL